MSNWYRNLINLLEGAEPLVLYHGTHAKFDGVPTIPESGAGLYGRGVYFSTDKRVAQGHGPTIVTCTVSGKLATNAQLDAAREQASEEGFVRSEKMHRARDILIDAGYVGVQDKDLVVVYVQDAMTRV
jgi:hypothetical protein